MMYEALPLLTRFCIVVAANVDDLDEKAKVPVVQQKGRFKVTSENVESEKVNGNSNFDASSLSE